jgi:hypothetical protein
MADPTLPIDDPASPVKKGSPGPAVDPMTEDEVHKWESRIDAALAVQEPYLKWWDVAIKNYSPSVKENPDAYSLEVRTNRLFSIVERKKADLFYKQPDLTVAPSPLLETIPNSGPMVAAHAALLNHKLGLYGVKATTLGRDAIFAYLLFGAGWTKIYYRTYTVDVERPKLDPMGQPALDPMGAPQMETVPVPIYTECCWEAFSNRQALIPSEFRSTDFDKAPWLGQRFTMSLTEARGIWKDHIPDDFTGSGAGGSGSSDKAQWFNHGAIPEATRESTKDVVTGIEIYYRTCLENPKIVHPLHLTKVVFIDGLDDPVEHRPSPDQTFDAQGRLTPDSLIGYPYHPLTIRTLTDSAYLMSDVMVALPQTQELDKYRVQGVKQRDINNTVGYYSTGKLPPAELDKAIRAPQGGLVGLPDEAFNDPRGPIKWQEHAPIPPDNYSMSSQIDFDLSHTFAIDATAVGVANQGTQTATESNLRQANVNVRQGADQGFVADWFVTGAAKIATLMQRYYTVEDAAAVIGPQAAQQWDQWRHQVPVPMAFKMTPDSSLKNDSPLDRMQFQQLYSYVAQDPHWNRAYLNERLAEKYHLDPSKVIVPDQQLPQPKPEPPKATLAFKGEDLSPLSPQSPIVLDILMKLGMKIDPEALLTAHQIGEEAATAAVMATAQQTSGQGTPPDTTHGGKLAPAETLDKHLAERTGGMQGSGEASPEMAGGMATGPSGVM